jgi:hypothetical protein
LATRSTQQQQQQPLQQQRQHHQRQRQPSPQQRQQPLPSRQTPFHSPTPSSPSSQWALRRRTALFWLGLVILIVFPAFFQRLAKGITAVLGQNL